MSIDMYEGMVWMKTRQTRSRYEALDNKCAELNKQDKNLIPPALMLAVAVIVKQWSAESRHDFSLVSAIVGPLQSAPVVAPSDVVV